METKKWYASKTNVFNLLITVSAIAGLPELLDVIPDNYDKMTASLCLFLVAVVNIVLRVYFTDKPIDKSLK